MPSKGVTHPYPARALMAILDFMVYRRVILKSDQEASIVALCDAVKNGWHSESVPEASPKDDLRRLVQTSWRNNLESRWSLEVRCWLAWSSIVPTFSYSSTIVSRTTVTQPTRGRRASPGELSYRALVSALITESALDTSWSRGGRHCPGRDWDQCCSSVRRVPEEQRYDHRLLQNVRGTPWEPKPGDVSTDLPEPMLIIPQLHP